MSDSMQPPPPPAGGAPPPPAYSPPPGYGPPPGAGPSGPLPWDERERLGYVNALVETVKLLLTEPRDAFGRIKVDGDYVGAFLFGLIVSWVMAIVSQIWSFAFSSLFSLGSLGSLDGFEGMGLAAGVGVGQVLVTVVIWPFIFVVTVFIGAGIYHLFLMLLGALDRSEGGFEGTFKVVCYGQVGNLGNIVPLVGSLISLVAVLVLYTLGLERVHRTSTGKAAAAVLIPIALCCICFAVIFAFFGAAIAAAMAGAAGQ